MSDNFLKIKKGISFKGYTEPTNPEDGDVYFDSVQGFLGYSYGSWGPLGGGGVVNYDTNPNVGSTVGYNLYNDGAVAIPVSGSGGTVTNLTFTSTQTSPIFAHTMGVLTKAAANCQGEGFSYDFNIDPVYQAGILQVSFAYQVSADFQLGSGAISGDSSDIEMFVYDITNNAILYVTPQTLTEGLATPGTFTGTFQTSPNSTSYRMIWHIATTNASAWTFNISNIVIGPNQTLQQAPQISAIYTSSTVQANGVQFFENKVEDTSGAVSTPGSAWTFTAPIAGLYDVTTNIETANLPFNGAEISILQNGTSIYTSNGQYHTSDDVQNGIVGPKSTKMRLAAGDTIQISASMVTTGSPATSGNPETNYVMVTLLQPTVPTTTVGAVVVASAGISGSYTVTTAGAQLIFDTVAGDTTGSYNPGTGVYTIPAPGWYDIQAQAQVQNNEQATNYDLAIIKNGTAISASTVSVGSTPTLGVFPSILAVTKVYCQTGDLITVFASNNTISSQTWGMGVTSTFLNISRITGPANQTGNNYAIGEIGAAYLTEAQWNAQKGPGWVLQDGRSCAGSAYAALSGNLTVPDARATVLRMKDNGAGLDSYGDLPLGTYEPDQFASHTHPTEVYNNSSQGVFGSGNASNPLAGVNTGYAGGGETNAKSTVCNFFIKIN